MLFRIEFEPKQRTREVQIRLQGKCGVALEEIVAVAEKKMAIFQRPKIANAIVDGPCGFSFDITLQQVQHQSANLALIGFRAVSGVAAQQAGNAKS